MKKENPVEILDEGFERIMIKYYGKDWRKLPPETRPNKRLTGEI